MFGALSVVSRLSEACAYKLLAFDARRTMLPSSLFFLLFLLLSPPFTFSLVLLSPAPGLVEEAVSSPTFVLASSLF